MSYVLFGLLGTNLIAVTAAIVFRHQRDSQRARAERESEARRAAEAKRDEAVRIAHAAAADARKMVENERKASDARVQAERAAAASAAGINARAQAGDPGALRAALDDLEVRR